MEKERKADITILVVKIILTAFAVFVAVRFLACSQPESKTTAIPPAEGSSAPLKIGPYDSTKPIAYIGTQYYRIRFSVANSHLSYMYDSTLTITGDTMKVIRMVVEQLDRTSNRNIELSKENDELKKLIQRMIDDSKGVQYTLGKECTAVGNNTVVWFDVKK